MKNAGISWKRKRGSVDSESSVDEEHSAERDATGAWPYIPVPGDWRRSGRRAIRRLTRDAPFLDGGGK
jgi:hypothetical protein